MERGRRLNIAASQCHAFEVFAHRSGKSKGFDLARQFELPDGRQCIEVFHFILQSTAHQKMRLILESVNVEPALDSRLCDS